MQTNQFIERVRLIPTLTTNSIWTISITSMLVTDVEDQIGWWPSKYIEKITNITKNVANMLLPPTSQISYHHKATNITVTTISKVFKKTINFKFRNFSTVLDPLININLLRKKFTLSKFEKSYLILEKQLTRLFAAVNSTWR